jgi:hypothetical protein
MTFLIRQVEEREIVRSLPETVTVFDLTKNIPEIEMIVETENRNKDWKFATKYDIGTVI